MLFRGLGMVFAKALNQLFFTINVRSGRHKHVFAEGYILHTVFIKYFLIMYRIIKIALFVIFGCITASAQTPGYFSYQAVACDASGDELIDQKISVRASILKDGPNGVLQYTEVHSSPSLKTDAFGLFTLEVGNGVVQPGPVSTLLDINWSTGNYWLRIEMDPTGGFNFNFVGANRLLAVPYALFSARAKLATQSPADWKALGPPRRPNGRISSSTTSSATNGNW